MPYDKSLDAETFKETKEFEDTRITVGVFSYNGGAKKLQISRENRNQSDEWQFTKLGRLTKDEVDAVLPLLTKAAQAM